MPYQRGSGFVGLQQYLNANREAAERMGGALAGQAETAEQGAHTGIEQAGNIFGFAAGVGTPHYGNEPANEMDAARAAGNAVYKGPHELKDVVDVGALENQITAAGQVGQLASTDAGRATLLQQQYGQGYTTQGGRGLDAFLAGRGAGDRLSAAGGAMDRLKAYLATTQQGAKDRAAAGEATAKGVQQQYTSWRPTPTLGEVRRNPVGTPWAMPSAPQPKGHGFFSNLGRRLFGGG